MKRILSLPLTLALCAGAASGADSAFVPGAFNGTWVNVNQDLTTFQQIPDAEGLQLVSSLGDAQFAAANCPAAGEKREFYRGSGRDSVIAGCTNGSTFNGVFTDSVNGVPTSGWFVSKPIPDWPGGGTPYFEVTLNSKLQGTAVMRLDYVSGASLLAGTAGFRASVWYQLKKTRQGNLVPAMYDRLGQVAASNVVSVSDANVARLVVGQ